MHHVINVPPSSPKRTHLYISFNAGADLPPFSEDSDGLLRSEGNVIDEDEEGDGEELFGDDMERFVLRTCRSTIFYCHKCP